MNCSSCQADLPENSKFCGQCGTPVQQQEVIAERRQITVLFCDLVGSTALSSQLDPEDLRELTRAYHEVCAAVIGEYDGHIAQYLGDGILVYFGYPNAHEDDAYRACETALGVLRGIARLDRELQPSLGQPVQVRVGIHTGPVVVGEVGEGNRRENLALGATPNIAARVQSFAEPGQALVSADTLNLVQGFFESEDLGSHQLKGLNGPLRMHRLLNASGAQGRLQAASDSGLTEFTGRDIERSRLATTWAQVRDGGVGNRQVLIQGEAGIGKSRLTLSLKELALSAGDTVIECACSAYYTSTPLYPVVGALSRVLGFSRTTSSAEKWQSIRDALTRRDLFSDENVLLIGQLMGLEPLLEQASVPISPQDQRERTLEVVVQLVRSAAQDGPVMFLLEDLHWSDPTTLEFVERLAIEVDLRLLVILTARPEFSIPSDWTIEVPRVGLSRLNAFETETLIARVAKHKRLPDEVQRLLIERSDGVPFFAEEMTKAVLELGVLEEREHHFELRGSLPDELIPATLNSSLITRLDNLRGAKPVAQLASILGREFRLDVLQAVSSLDERDLTARLTELVDAELIHPLEDALDSSFQFKHALIQEAAYQSLLRSARKDLHLKIAQTLTADFADLSTGQPEVLAQHFEEGGDARQAAQSWLQATQLSMARAANHEALAHGERVVKQLQLLDPSSEVHNCELEANLVMVSALQTLRGWGCHAIEELSARSTELLEALGESKHALVVEAQMLPFLTLRGDINKGLALSTVRLAKMQSDPNVPEVMMTLGYGPHAVLELYQGRIEAAIESAEKALTEISPQVNQTMAQRMGLAPEVNTCSYLSEAWWMRGYPDKAIAYSERALASAQSLGHGPSIEFAVGYQAEFYQLFSDADKVMSVAEESLRLASVRRSEFWHPMISVYQGWAACVAGDLAEGIQAMRSGIDRYRAAGNGLTQIHLLAMLAEALLLAEHEDAALSAIVEARTISSATGERYYLPEIFRLEGLLMAQRGEQAASVAALERAVAESQAQGARSLALRALMSLHQLQPNEARFSRLKSALAEFSEGFDSVDLKLATQMVEVTA